MGTHELKIKVERYRGHMCVGLNEKGEVLEMNIVCAEEPLNADVLLDDIAGLITSKTEGPLVGIQPYPFSHHI